MKKKIRVSPPPGGIIDRFGIKIMMMLPDYLLVVDGV